MEDVLINQSIQNVKSPVAFHVSVVALVREGYMGQLFSSRGQPWSRPRPIQSISCNICDTK